MKKSYSGADKYIYYVAPMFNRQPLVYPRPAASASAEIPCVWQCVAHDLHHHFVRLRFSRRMPLFNSGKSTNTTGPEQWPSEWSSDDKHDRLHSDCTEPDLARPELELEELELDERRRRRRRPSSRSSGGSWGCMAPIPSRANAGAQMRSVSRCAISNPRVSRQALKP